MKYVLERLIVEAACLANIILTKPQLTEQAVSLVILLEPIPPHVCLSTRRVAAVLLLLPSLTQSLTTPTKWNHIFKLLMKDATNEYSRPLVWRILCRLLEEKKVSVINFVPVIKCCLQMIDQKRDPVWVRQIIEYIFALTTYLTKIVPILHSELIDTVDNVPSIDQCWLQCITVLRSFADTSGPIGEETAEFAIDRLQRCILRQGDLVPSGVALLKCFDSVMLSLLTHYGRSEREKGYVIGVFVATLLASSETLAKQAGFSQYWLRVVDVLCNYTRRGGSLGETTVERLKNMLLVMSIEGRFDMMSVVTGQNVLEATMTMIDSFCPYIRDDLEGAFNQPEEKEVNEEINEKVNEEVNEEINEEVNEEVNEEINEGINEVTRHELKEIAIMVTDDAEEMKDEYCVEDKIAFVEQDTENVVTASVE